MSNSGITRRDVIKWGTFVGAALGLPHWKVLECLEWSGGRAMAQALGDRQTLAVVIGEGPNGAPAHYQQVWGVSKQMAPRPGNTPVYSATTKVTLPAGAADEIHATDAYPFKDIPGVSPSIFVAGNDTTHTNIQNMFGGLTFGPNIYFPALVSAAQAVDNATLPQVVIGNNTLVGTAPGQRAAARASTADAFAGLFAKEASKVGNVLAADKAGVNAPMFKTAFTTWCRLMYASGVSRDRIDYQTAMTLGTGKAGTEILAKNLGDLLKPTTEELTRYGVNVAGMDATLVNLAKSLITFRKAVGSNLTLSLVVQAAPGNDPHGANPVGGGTTEAKTTWVTLGKIWNEFTKDMLAAKQDYLAVIAGDTAKSVVTSDGWPDGTGQDDHSLAFAVDTTKVLKAGISGQYGPGVNRRAHAVNPVTGAPDVTVTPQAAATAMHSAMLYSIVRGKTALLPGGVTFPNYQALINPVLQT